jgi:hypothetical protein
MADARRAIESSADFTRGGTPPIPDHDATERQRAERIEAEQRRLIAWAKAHGKLGGRLPKDDVGGGEHIVRLDEKADRVIKATHGATPSEYLDRLNLQNLIFNDDIRLERVVVKSGQPVIVTSQPAIKGTVPTQAAIDETMDAKGFEKLTPGAYYDEPHGLLLFDLFPKKCHASGGRGDLSV